MRYREVKTWIIFIGGIIMAGFFVWFGFLLFSLAAQETTTAQLFLLGSVCILASVFSMTNVKKHNLLVAISLLAVGIYYFARTAGYITDPILVRLLGVASWAAAALLVYLTYPNHRSFNKVTRSENTEEGSL